MDKRLLEKLHGVHPALVSIIEKAAQEPKPFIVVYGMRTPQAEAEAIKTGHSQTMHSRHLPNNQGLACAVDLAAIDAEGAVDWAAGREAEVYGAIALQIKAAADELGLGAALEWGGDPVGAWEPGEVSHFRDWGHFQLSWQAYP